MTFSGDRFYLLTRLRNDDNLIILMQVVSDNRMGSDEKSNFGKYVKRAPDLVKGSVPEQSEDGLGAFNRVNNQLDYVRRRYSAEYKKGYAITQSLYVLFEVGIVKSL